MPTKLGQNFLINKDVVKKIVQSANLTPDDLVLEIGPGKGILTEKLAKYAGKVVAVEIDESLVSFLKNKFKNQKNIEIIKEDILKINLIDLRNPKTQNPKNTKYQIQNTKYKLIANLPYYITSPIIRKFLEAEFPPSEMILMIQKEVAERIVAKPGKMSILAVSVQYYAKPEILFYVGKENFDPVPEVDSAVIKITPYLKSPLSLLISPPKGKGDKFFSVVRAGFSAKRKTLVNNLAASFHLEKSEVEKKLNKIGIKKNSRAQELSIENWKNMAEIW